MFERTARQFITPTLTLMRIVVGFLYVPHGGQKLFGWFGGMPGPSPTAVFPSLVWFGGILEFFGGLCILLGIFTRPVAFLLCGQMAVAYFKFHAPGGFWPLLNHGEMAALYCFVFLFLAAYGGGPLAVERLWCKPEGGSFSGRGR
jgi:putative oxidoreductase